MYENFDYIKMSETLENRLVWVDEYKQLRDMFWGLSTLLHDLGLTTPYPRTITRIILDYMLHTNRKYHTPVHVIGMFEWAEKHNIKLSKAQQLAIWFHDSIYVVLSKDSERRSADLLKALVGETNPPHVSSHAQCIITYTRDFMKDTDNTWPEGSDLVMDLDLSHFAREEEVFLYTNKLVKEEFVPVVGEEEYEKGRKDFFEQLLSRKNIFRTNLFKEKFEAKARENIEKVLRS